MSGSMGGGNSNSTTQTVYTGLQIQTSAQGIPVPIVWGKKRIGTNLIWYGDFTATPDNGKKGGKGGDGKGGGIYNYSTAVMMSLGEGAGSAGFGFAVGTVWADKQITSLAELGLTLFTGTDSQAPWSYLTSKHPDQALSYAYTAYVANSSYALGKSPNLPNHTFEVNRTSTFTWPGWSFPGINDSRMSGVMYDFLTNPQYSIGMATSAFDVSSFSVDYTSYNAAQGLWFSPSLETQEQITSIIDRWAQLSNTWVFWTGSALKAIPLGDAPIASPRTYTLTLNTQVPLDPGPYTVTLIYATSDGGVSYQQGGSLTAVGGSPSRGQYHFNASSGVYTFNAADTGRAITITSTYTYTGPPYTPNTTIVFDLNYDNLVSVGGKPPIDVDRADQADLANHVRLEFKNRNNAYNSDIAEWKDDGLINKYGVIDHPITQAYEICDPVVAQTVAQLMGQRAAYIRNTYTFTVNWWMGSYLEPGDFVTLTDPHLGLSFFPVRLRTLEEDEGGNWLCVAEEYTGTVGDASGTVQSVVPVNVSLDTHVDPGSINPPSVFEPASNLTGGQAQLWVAASGGANWGGCVVYVSFDSTNYTNIGTITQSAVQGILTANLANHADPDTVDTLSIDTTISQVSLNNDATHADADNFRTLAMVQPAFSTTVPNSGECISYGAVAITGTFTDNITYLRRGLYGTSPASHVIGDFFTRFDLSKVQAPGNSMLVWPIPPQYIGSPIYLKFCSFNRFANELQPLSSATAYTYTPTGAGYGGGTGGVPTAPTGLTATPGIQSVALSWTPNPTTDNVTKYTVYRATGLSQPFGSASQIAVTTGTSYVDNGLSAGAQYTYFVEAVNVVGSSQPTAGVNATVGGSAAGIRYDVSTFYPGVPAGSQLVLRWSCPRSWTVPSGMTNSEATARVAATSSAPFTVAKISGGVTTTVATITWAASATVATFSSSGFSLAAGDVLTVTGPSTADATLADIAITIAGVA